MMNPDKKDGEVFRVDFSYAFSTPHRLTVALPDSSNKTLLDIQAGSLRMAWSYGSLMDKPLATFIAPKTDWEVILTPELDGAAFPESRWTRMEGWLPVLENMYEAERTSMRLDVAGGGSAAIMRIEMENHDDRPHRLGLRCDRPGGWMGFNPAWVQAEWDNDVLLAGWMERTDRVLVLAIGGDAMLVPNANTLFPVWDLKPGEKKRGWLVRPYQAYQSMLPILRREDWGSGIRGGKTGVARSDRTRGADIDSGLGCAACFSCRAGRLFYHAGAGGRRLCRRLSRDRYLPGEQSC